MTNHSFRLLMVTPRYFPFMGGIESHVYETGRRLVAAGVDVTVLTTDPSGTLAPEEQVEGMRIQRVRAYPRQLDFYFAPGVYQAIQKGNWDMIHCQGCHTFVPPLAMLAAKRARKPYVLTFHTGGHSSRVRNAVRGMQWQAMRPLFARAQRLIGVSHFEADYFQARLGLPPEKFSVIPNGGRLPDLAQASTQKSDGTLLVSVGRLERYKGHHRVIAALPQVLKLCPDARLLILGSGPYKTELVQLAAQMGVADRVEIRAVPPSERQEMANVLSQAALVLLLSDYEAHPVAVMEALALKRPVLVADTSGLRELAERGLVHAIPLNSTPDDTARAIYNELLQPLIPVNVKFPTWEECAHDLLALYQNILQGQRCVS